LSIETSCLLESKIIATLHGQGGAVSSPTTSFAIDSQYLFSLPLNDQFYGRSVDTFSFPLTRVDGTGAFFPSLVTQSSPGSASCSNVEVDNADQANPQLNVSNCTGDGVVSFVYGDNESFKVMVDNNEDEILSSPIGVVLNSAENKAYVVDSGVAALFEVDLATGNRVILSR
jgi:hypothetical protein